MSMNLVVMLYLLASVCFIQALKGLSHPRTSILGNAFESGLGAMWEAMGPAYGRHAARDYPAYCGRCDEYHTFNA